MDYETLAGKKILILGGGGQCLKVVRAAKELGVYVVVADIKANRLVAEEADEYLQCSLLDSDEIVKWCKDNSVDGILNFCVDFAQKTQYKISQELHLHCCYGYDEMNVLTDKRAFKNALSDFDLDTIESYTIEDVYSQKAEFPLLVKPAESSGSRGSTVCYTVDDFNSAVVQAKSYSRNDEIVIEKYMGTENDFCVTYFVVDGEPYLIRIGDRYLGKIEDGLERQCICAVFPSKYTDKYVEKIDQKVKKMIRGIGLKNGPMFMQGFFDGDTVRWYDPGIRFSGGEYELYYKQVWGIDFMSAMVRFALTGNMKLNKPIPNDSYKLNGFSGTQLLIDAGPGVISVFSGLDEIKRMPEVAVVTQKHFVGDEIKKTGDIKQRICEIDIVTDCPKENIRSIVERIQKLIVVLDENGESMLISQMDARII